MRARRSWCDQELRHSSKSQYGYWKEGWELAQLLPRSLIGLPGLFRQLLQHFGADAQILPLQTARHQGFRNIIHLCEWLDGVWLKQYTLAQIQQVAIECEIHASRLSIRIQNSIRSRNYWAKFEFDVAFMRHYQLFALSCTTTESQSLFKQKLIEANLRARQLGRAKARAALVCCHHNPDRLRSELEAATRNRNQRIAAFERSDLPSLGQKTVNWVKQNG